MQMKKRGQRPDAHTYIILLRGLAENAHYPTAVEKAMTIYKSISADNSSIKGPNTAHTNALLKVCARAGELDTMFGIAADLPVKGVGAADNLTFTTILNALRTMALATLRQFDRPASSRTNASEEEREIMRDKIFKEAIMRGIRMWDDIVGRWRGGDLFVDEELVCTIGRLLLMGGYKEHIDDVFLLVDQMMNVPRPQALVEEEERNGMTKETESADYEDPHSLASGQGDKSDLGFELAASHHMTFTSRPARTGVYAKPGNNTLSLLLEACTLKPEASAGPKAARQYWGILTEKPYSLLPDTTNYNDYLRLLRRHRASKEATQIVCEDMASRKDITFLRKTFLMAMSACCRNRENPKVFDQATQIVQLMLKRLPEPDVKTLAQYVGLAVASTNVDNLVQNGPRAASNMLTVLDLFNSHSINLKALSDFGSKWSHLEPASEDAEAGTTVKKHVTMAGHKDTYQVRKKVITNLLQQDKENTLDLIKMLTSGLDKLLEADARAAGTLLMDEQRRKLRNDKRDLSAFVTAAMVRSKGLEGKEIVFKRGLDGKKMAYPRGLDGKKIVFTRSLDGNVVFTRKERRVDVESKESKEEREKKDQERKEDEEIRGWVRKNMPRHGDEKRGGGGFGVEF
jgi:hypothetical protein